MAANADAYSILDVLNRSEPGRGPLVDRDLWATARKEGGADLGSSELNDNPFWSYDSAGAGSIGLDLQTTGSKVSPCLFHFTVPGDYDDVDDTLKLVVTARYESSSAGTVQLGIDADNTKHAQIGADWVSLTSAQTPANQTLTATYAEYVFDLSGLGLGSGDAINIAVAGQTDNAGDEIEIAAVKARYKSNIALTVQGDRD